MRFHKKVINLCAIVHDVRMTDMDQQQKQSLIQHNQQLKGITWKEAGIPTLTNLVYKPIVQKPVMETYPDDFILDFDDQPVKENGHQINCSCKQCLPKPKSDDPRVLAFAKTEEGIRPLNNKRF